MKKFNCTQCGACCAKVRGPYLEWLKPYGGVRQDGSCANYDHQTRRCMIYDTRPDFCRVDKVAPDGDYSRIYKDCDVVHQMVYGQPREQDGVCAHPKPEPKPEPKPQIRLQFETVSTCNAACHFCPYPILTMRKGNTMSWELFAKIAEEAKGISVIDVYSLQGLGEPLLDKHLVERVRVLAEDPKAQIEMFTNGVLATPEKLDALHAAGLDCIVFSLNANNAEQHQAAMSIKGKYETVVKHIEYATSLDWLVRVHAVEDGKVFNAMDSVAFKARWGDLCRPIGAGNWAGDLDFNVRQFKPNECCFRALSTIYVTWNGQVTMCCFDPTGEGAIFGDLTKQTLREVYSDPRYVQFREDHSNDKADRYERCKGCSRI